MDLNAKEVPLVARNLLDGGADGVVVAGPLSMSKNSLMQLPGHKDEHVGMLTGALVKEQTVSLIRQIYEQTKGQIPIIGCGGVFSAEDALAQIYAGASLIQLDTASLTFAGPNCVAEIHKDLLRLLKEKNFPNVSHAVGFSVKGNVPPQDTPSSVQQQSASVPVQPSVQPQPEVSVSSTTQSKQSQPASPIPPEHH